MKQLLNAKAENIKENSFVKGFSIDSRTLKEGDIFFCIKGERTDGHNYIPEVIERGASCIVANPKYVKENLLKRQNKCEEELNKVSKRLTNKSFVSKAPKNIVDQEKSNYSDLKNDIQKITLIIESL